MPTQYETNFTVLSTDYDELRTRTTEQEKTIARLNDANQRLRQRERARDSAGDRTLRLGAENIGNVTTLNHALNICRDPCRKFIVRKLRAIHGDDLTNALAGSIEFRDNQRSSAAESPEAVFDVTDFSAIISSNPNCFEDWFSLSRKMDEVRHIRNRASHPPPGGLGNDWGQDSLRTILEALEYLGDRETGGCVAEIRELFEAMSRV